MSFVHLHVHSEYSLLDGMTRINDLVAKAKELNMPAVAITDHGALYGAFKFYIKAKEAGIKPIIGCEVYKAKKSRFDKEEADREQNHLLLIAKNYTGYKNLLHLVSLSSIEGFYYKPRVDFELLEKYKEGLIATTTCLNGEIPEAIEQGQIKKAETLLKRYLDIFDSNFYIELQRHPGIPELDRVNPELIKLSRKFGVPLVATNDVHYLNKDDAYAQEILLCIQTQRAIFEKERPLSMMDTPDFYFKTAEEMKALYSDYPEAIENTLKIADSCDLEIPYGKLILPQFKLAEGVTAKQYLHDQVYSHLDKVKDYPEDVVRARVDYELNIISQKGYDNYFLFVSDFVNWAKDQKIAVGPGRGSAAGSLVSFILNITGINPLLYNIPFERFLNPERPSPPDIDLDFADSRRDEVLQYIASQYGSEKVAQVITFGKLESRMAVRDVARALGLSYAQGDRISKMIPPPIQGFHLTLEKAVDQTPALKLAYNTEEDVKKVVDIAKKLEGLPRHASVHAAAVIIADKPLVEYVPLQKETKEGRIITQYDMYSLDLNVSTEAIGLMKMDVLGLRNLTILEEALRYVRENKQIDLSIYEISLTNKKAFELIASGETVGIFQLESGGMRKLAKDLQPNKISDIAALVALYRPGPMSLIPSFIEGKKNPKKIKYLHPDLRPIFEETYGVVVYQEQVLEIANKFAGYTIGEADILRKAMGKKKKEIMAKEKKKFIDGAIKKGYTKKLVEDIFAFIEKFAAYGFGKAHSFSYAYIAYWTAYLKANYPVEFMTALLSAELQGVAGPMREQKMAQAIEECRKMEITVLPADINKSGYNFSIEGKAIRFGLSAIKNVGQAAIESIIEARRGGPFISFKDFLMRIDLRKVNKKTVESLIKAGVFSEFANRATLLTYYPQAVREITDKKADQDKGQFGLFAVAEADSFKDSFEILPEFTDEELALMEKEVIGFLITKNPLATHQKILDEKVTKKLGEIQEDDVNKTYIMGGIISAKKLLKTKKDNSDMAFVNVFDETGSIEVIVFPTTFKKLKDSLFINHCILMKGKVNNRDGKLSIILENAVSLDKAKRSN